jgi:DNA transformation protein
MSPRSNFVDSLHEVFERFGRISARRMFGGHGLFHDGRMFALVTGETLYLKADAGTAVHFDRLHLPAFSYDRHGKMVQMSYRAAPVEVFEDHDAATLWARRAWEAALRSGKARKPAPAPARKTKRSTP